MAKKELMNRLLDVASFNFKDTRGYTRTLIAGKPPPSKITEYIVGPADWSKYSLPELTTVNDILGMHLDRGVPCGMCGSRGETCEANDCVDEFRRQVSAYGENITEIRTVPGMGKGVFATATIPSGVWIGEYLGKLIAPQLQDESRVQGNMYLFEFDDKVLCDASQFGNWTRFMNHHCNPNVAAMDFTYARRKVIGFRTTRRIEKGQQLFIWYGVEYFQGNDLWCRCSAEQGEHMPRDSPSSSADTAAGNTAAPPGCTGEVYDGDTALKTNTVNSTTLGLKSSKVTKSSKSTKRKSSSRKKKADALALRNRSRSARLPKLEVKK